MMMKSCLNKEPSFQQTPPSFESLLLVKCHSVPSVLIIILVAISKSAPLKIP